MIYGIISEFTDKGQFQYLTNLKGPQEGTYLYTTQFLSLMPRSHIHGSPRRFYYGLNLTDDPGNAITVVRYGCTIYV